MMRLISSAAVLGCFLAVAIQADTENQEIVDAVIAMAEDCREAGTTDDDIRAVAEDKEDLRHEGKCVIACLAQKFGMMTDSGEMSEEGVMKIVHMMTGDENKSKKASKILEKCKNLKDVDKCEKAYKIGKCFREEVKNLELDD